MVQYFTMQLLYTCAHKASNVTWRLVAVAAPTAGMHQPYNRFTNTVLIGCCGMLHQLPACTTIQQIHEHGAIDLAIPADAAAVAAVMATALAALQATPRRNLQPKKEFLRASGGCGNINLPYANHDSLVTRNWQSA